MKTYFLNDGDLSGFVTNLIEKSPVFAPVAKKTRFVFDKLESVDDLRLDYDTTILPPKKLFVPTKQDLVKFDNGEFEECIEPEEKILFGVHPYDIKAIAMMDWIHEESNFDIYYHSNRQATTIIGSSVQNHYKRAFFGSVCKELKVMGHDMFLTKITDGYLVEVLTKKGGDIIPEGNFTKAAQGQIDEAAAVNQKADKNCPEKLNNSSLEIKHKIRMYYDSDVWKKKSEDCFSCGSCNIVCPTCYCFDIQDDWGLGAADGKRYRRWDACLTCEFSEVAVQGGSENFREERAERYRHRIMRKTSFLNDKLGGPACVGCGRCAGTCTADVADPVAIINEIMEK